MVVLLLLAGLLAYMYWPMGSVKIIISRETTYITGPLNPDGTVNYVAYLDANYAEGVTPENNAAPLLLRAMGPMMLPSTGWSKPSPEMTSRILRRLGLPANFFDRNDFFVAWGNLASPDKAEGTDANSDESDYVEDESGPSLYDVRQMIFAGEMHPDIEPWLARNVAPLEIIRQASIKPRCYMPLVCWSTSSSIQDLSEPPLYAFRQAADSLTIRSLIKFKHNDLAGAWDDLLAAHRLSRLLAQGPTMDAQMGASGIDAFASQIGVSLATRGDMPAKKMRMILKELIDLKPVSRIEEVEEKYQRFVLLDAIGVWARGQELYYLRSTDDDEVRLPDPSSLDYNQMLRDMNCWYDRVREEVRLARLKDPGEASVVRKGEDMKLISSDGPPGKLGVFVYNHGGRPFRKARTKWMTNILLFMKATNNETAWDIVDRTRMLHEIETLAVALACYHAEYGRWPSELDELCPSLLNAIPIDRFSGKPLIYRLSDKGYLLYSIGKNRRDDGGRLKTNCVRRKRADDIVAKVEPAGEASRPATSQPAAPAVP